MPEVKKDCEMELLRWMGYLADFIYMEIELWVKDDNLDEVMTVSSPALEGEEGWRKYEYSDFCDRIEELTPEYKRVLESVEKLRDYFMIARDLEKKAYGEALND